MSYRSYRYKNTAPRWIEAKFASTCKCGASIKKGDNVLYYPYEKRVACQECSEQHQRDMDANAFDEAVYSGNSY